MHGISWVLFSLFSFGDDQNSKHLTNTFSCVIESNSNQVIIQNTTMFTHSNDYHQDNSVPDEQIADQNLSFLDFDFMANELFDVTDDFLQGRNF
jgi:hypothetical protein